MSSKLALALAAIGWSGCTVDDAPVYEIPTLATMEVSIGPPIVDGVPEGQGQYRWELVLAPSSSKAPPPEGGAVASFTPDVRGTYVIERWLQYGLGQDLTHRFIVRAEGIAPIAFLTGSTQASVGTPTLLDGSDSMSLELRSLQFHWRLVDRPRDSTATLLPNDTPTTSFIPDLPGRYDIELAVFDGELWNEAPSFLIIQAM